MYTIIDKRELHTRITYRITYYRRTCTLFTYINTRADNLRIYVMYT